MEPPSERGAPAENRERGRTTGGSADEIFRTGFLLGVTLTPGVMMEKSADKCRFVRERNGNRHPRRCTGWSEGSQTFARSGAYDIGTPRQRTENCRRSEVPISFQYPRHLMRLVRHGALRHGATPKRHNLMRDTPRIPDLFRRFSCTGYTNVFSFLPDCPRFYATETLFGDWEAPVLLLAKDAAPTKVIRELARTEGNGAWRHAERRRNDAGGYRTNERLVEVSKRLPGPKLYGSALANLLCDDPRWSRALPGFFSGPLHDYLADVLRWVIDSMPNLQAIACIGEHAWFLTAHVLGQSVVAREAARYRDEERFITGHVGARMILATSHFHPARGSRDQWNLGWARLVTALSASASQVHLAP